ncbi:hypothetical protein AQUCO_04400063v1 [Aquilegia coerulea]|uniref:Sister chromatid cohesion protein DCC1 n=1 Tax=Aquilegia coerulea TaxID=218851 RepID=A0A2G5CMS2_AQUCA|nr:hypothetical protein AQUCO_04400063v1 [Aquilegia coerulea]
MESSRERGAEAVLNLKTNSSVSITYHPLFGLHDDLLLLEIDDKILPHVLNNRVIVRGQPDEDAVFCTSTTTYALKFVGTSNSVFLIPPSDCSFLNGNDVEEEKVVASVIKVAPGVMELVEVAPKLDKLKWLLAENPYKGGEEDFMEELSEMGGNWNNGLYRWEDLVDRVQASDGELREGLRAFNAVEICGYWRIVDEMYMGMVLSMVLHNSVLCGWSLGALNEDEVVGVLESDGFPREIARHCLEMYGNKVRDEDGGYLWKLDERKVCVHFARSVLSGGKMKMDSFMEKWMQKIPGGMIASFEMLEGEVLSERIGVETWIRSFSVSSLPCTPAERFAALFRERQKWESKELDPYIRDLRVPGLSSEGLLLKYTRRTQPTLDAEPIFTAR